MSSCRTCPVEPEEVPGRLRVVLEEALAGRPTALLAGRVQQLIEAYRSGEVPAAVILDDPATVSAYAAYRMPATVAALRSALGELYDAVPDLAVEHLVDLGGGTGATGWAVASLDGGLARVDVLEQAAPARAAGADLARRSGIPALVESRWHPWTLGSSRVPAGTGDADLAVVSYVLGELPEPLRPEAVEVAASLASTVLVIEPGTPAGHDRVLAARERLLALGLRVAAPCPHGSACPLAEGDWCHFPARVERSALHRSIKGGELSYEDEKFSYVAATRLPVQAGSGRVLRHPLLRKGLVGLPLCLPDGTTAERVVSRRQGAGYKQARRTGWGDALR
ncbi:small ribosomal subunit Rsm22 family protein [Arsenicicoccus dermatophilus]|uniref:small ribosomal subunit Rsm22 family protein n=1 Tax=Arsenicicoccus dermatophilus TaxID=1076331 RepID=UPI0039174D14